MRSEQIREAIVAEARTWIGTPFVHQGAKKGKGVDCIQLVRGVGENSKAMRKVTPADERKFQRFYGRRPNPKVMRECLESFLDEIPVREAEAGDLLWSHWGNNMPIHMSLLGQFEGRLTIIHAIWPHNVTECTLGKPFMDRVVAAWRYPLLSEALREKAA